MCRVKNSSFPNRRGYGDRGHSNYVFAHLGIDLEYGLHESCNVLLPSVTL